MPQNALEDIAAAIRQRFDVRAIDEVAREFGILLARTEGPSMKDAGFAMTQFIHRPAYIESLARPGEAIRLIGIVRRVALHSVAINVNAGIAEAEIFWHEYYHLLRSPRGIQRSEYLTHHYSTEGALHFREERRASLFAALVLVPREHGCESLDELMERYAVSRDTAERAAEYYAKK